MPSPTNKPRRLKIGLVLDDSLDRPDGVQQYVLTLGDWLSNQGHEVHYLVGETKRTDLPRLHSLSRNIAVRFNGNRLSIPLPAKRRALRELCQRERFDIIHVQMPYSPFMAGRLLRALPSTTAVIGTFHILPHSRLVAWGSWVLGMSVRRSLRRFDRIFAVSSAAQQFAARAFRIRSTVLPNVIQVERFRQAQPMTDLQGASPTLLFLGRLVPRKGCHTLLKAATILRSQGVPYRLVMCGKGPLKAELKQYVTRHKLDSAVTFTGFVPEEDKPRYLASADIAIFPSSGGESFGIVLLEAMATGRSVVLGARNPGYESVLKDCDELLFAPEDAPALAERITYFLQDQAAREQVVQWQNEHVQQFDVDAVGSVLTAAYEKELRRRAQS